MPQAAAGWATTEWQVVLTTPLCESKVSSCNLFHSRNNFSHRSLGAIRHGFQEFVVRLPAHFVRTDNACTSADCATTDCAGYSHGQACSQACLGHGRGNSGELRRVEGGDVYAARSADAEQREAGARREDL